MKPTIKRISSLALLALTMLSVSSCYVRFSKECKDELRATLEHDIKGYDDVFLGEEKTVVFMPGAFSRITSMGSIDLVIVPSDESEPRVEIRGTTTYIDSVSVINEGGVLSVEYSCSRVIYGGETAYIFCQGIEEITMRGSNDLTVNEGLESESLSLWLTGSGDANIFDIAIKGDMNITGSGSGDITVSEVKAENINLEVKGSGDVIITDMDLTGKVNTKAKGSGDIRLEGRASGETHHTSGSGDYVSRIEGRD